VQPLAVELQLLSDVGGLPLRLAPGRGLMARVMANDGAGRGVLNIAGAVLEAELPRHVRAGEQVRLVVRELDAHRVVLELPRDTASTPPPPAAIALPGGGRLRVGEDEDEQAGGGARDPATQTLTLRYDAPHLGPLDLRFELDPKTLRITVAAAPGGSLELAQARAAELREAVRDQTGRPVSVTVTPRREPLDLYA
jgi:hypothetical protein